MMNLNCGKKDRVTYYLDVNGYEVKAQYHQEDIDTVFIPLLDKIQQIQSAKKCRIFVFLAGPAGCGKTTLGLVLEKLAKDRGMSMQCVGLDGFHYKQSYLDSHGLAKIKGHHTTFDVELLKQKLNESRVNDCYWPVYSRKIHNPIDDGVLVNKDIVLIEGNYLLLDEVGWKDSYVYCEYSIFISCEKEIVKERLIERKCKGGYTYEQAYQHYVESDSKNVELILDKSINMNVCLDYDGERYCIK